MQIRRVLLLVSVASLVDAYPQAPMSSRASNSSSPTVTLDYSVIVPTAGNESLGYYKYQNIRFAAVPTGELRFAKPTVPPIEAEINDGSLADADVDCKSSEDCLYLDVWAPANTSGRKLPVMVWTYGGGFTGGSKSENTPEGLFNLNKEFVFVAYNYRVGITGLANGLTLLNEGGTSNTALWDVQHAFQWVRKYIGAFGGDPNQITAVGFSAGASQTLFQMTRFAGHAEQLFDRAYIMSPGFVPGAGHEHAEVFWQNVSSAVGCDGGHLECMQEIDFQTLTDAASTVSDTYIYQFQPRVDGDFVADTYEAQFYQRRFNFSGAVVLSHEQHEANSQAWSGVNTTEDVATYLRIFFPSITDDVVQEVLALYPESDYSSPGLRFSDMKQSFDLTAHNLAVTQALQNQTWNAMVALSPATHGTDQNYYWYSNYTLSPKAAAGNSTSTNSTGMSGTPITGGLGGGVGGSTPGGSTEVDEAIAVRMQKYLLSFVLTGDPNTMWSDDKLYWPLYSSSPTNGSSAIGMQLVFNNTFYTSQDDLANSKALFWNKALWY